MRGEDRQPWHDRLDALLGSADRTNRERFSVDLKQLLTHDLTEAETNSVAEARPRAAQ
jgi:hypothetical protein